MSKQTEPTRKPHQPKPAQAKPAAQLRHTEDSHHLLQLARQAPSQLTPSQRTHLQQTYGNQTLTHLVNLQSPKTNNQSPPSIQPKLTVNAVGDKYEQEADAVAKEVVQKLNNPQPAATAQRQPEPENSLFSQQIQLQELSEDEMVWKKQGTNSVTQPEKPSNNLNSGGQISPVMESRIKNATGGKPIPYIMRQAMEKAFGAEFSNVQIHDNAEANELSKSLQARAFTNSNRIFFRAGEYDETSNRGQELLAHELTHVLQQNSLDIQRDYYDEERLMSLPPEEYPVNYSDYDENVAGMTSPEAPMSVIAPQYLNENARADQSQDANSSYAVSPISNIRWEAGAKQYGDAVKIATGRVRYEFEKNKNMHEVINEYQAGRISADAAEQKAVESRRDLISKTRSQIPGPEPALTLNEKAARRNIKGPSKDALGWRSPNELRAYKVANNKPAATMDILKSSGKANWGYTGVSILGGVLGLLGGILATQDMYNQLEGRMPVKLDGLDPNDFEIGHEFHNVPLGLGSSGTIRVERNFFFQKKFYVVDRRIVA